jgi:hypothetical protein
MNYGEFKNKVLMLINQYTIAGNDIALSYNNQDDYVLKIPTLYNSVMQYLATTTRHIYEHLELDWDAAEQKNGFYIFTMPEDFWQMVGRGIPIMEHGQMVMYHRYRWMGHNQLVIPARDKRPGMEVYYYRYPRRLADKPADDVRLDGEPDALEAAAYHVAAHLVMHDNAFAYSTLYNEFESRRQQMFERPQTEFDLVEDVYGTPGDGFYGV